MLNTQCLESCLECDNKNAVTLICLQYLLVLFAVRYKLHTGTMRSTLCAPQFLNGKDCKPIHR